MRVIIAGSPTVTDYSVVEAALAASGLQVMKVVSAAACCVDYLGERWCRELGVPVRRFSSDRRRHGESAWRFNNQQMVEYADALVAVWDCESPGTADMVRRLQAAGKPVYVYWVAGCELGDRLPEI